MTNDFLRNDLKPLYDSMCNILGKKSVDAMYDAGISVPAIHDSAIRKAFVYDHNCYAKNDLFNLGSYALKLDTHGKYIP